MQNASPRTSAPKTPALEFSGLRHRIGDRTLFDGIDLRLHEGNSVAVMGPSGSGKSTLLSCALGLVKPEGVVRVADSDLGRMSRREQTRHRSRHIGVVFQFGELLPELTPVENVALAGLLAGADRKKTYKTASELLGSLGVPRHDRPTGTLSGGERQRTAVARALVNQPSLLLADEPTGALDDANRTAVAELLFDVPRRWPCALLVVTHDAQVAALADDTVHLVDGKLVPQEAR
ncbi:ABC transporter ATP-binding protein [Streptomyces venezuelae]|uniref:ABC transporter ATP-binding protein n=1 Tax=Streptomyces venezuelae TaxID=54571 RepID=A0A5P2DME3_STRVZ|nr:ABC transporter ATP-binding protein [Streptomyces venezuelae]QES55770.1 ABC transporter ATP-binding protein [Streptomyces venezuelae]